MSTHLGTVQIGEGHPPLIVAEVSANHGQDRQRARDLVAAAAASGAGSVKFQAYTADTLTIDADTEPFRIEHPRWGGQTLHELYRKACMPWEWLRELKPLVEQHGMLFLCTAYDRTSVDFLEDLGVAAHKIASFELVDHELVRHAAGTRKPLVLSTGMASLEEITEARDIAREAGAPDVVLLKCVSDYPAKPAEMNLRTIPHLRRALGCEVGLSDHSAGIGAAVCAIALGASLVEKHVTLSRAIDTPDSFFSIEPQELAALVESARVAHAALGSVSYGPTEGERATSSFRRSLFVVRDARAGDRVTDDNVRAIRPGHGLHPRLRPAVLGKRFRKDVPRGTPLRLEDLEDACR
jgi:N-acetylneuraminate synthase